LNLESMSNASLEDMSMFLTLVEWFGLPIAVYLATEFHIPIVSAITFYPESSVCA
jgi:hypothetical protein